MKKVSLQKSFILTILALVFLVLPMLALKSPEKEICEGDIKAYCSHIGSEKSIYECLVENQKDISDECRSKLESYKKKIEDYKTACRDDLQEFCPEFSFKNWFRSFHCLSLHETDLTDECRYHLEVQSWIHEPDQVLMRD